MDKRWPAIDALVSDPDILVAALDDFGPTAVEERGALTRVFFGTAASRDAALASLTGHGTSAAAIDVPDENWAQRSQEGIRPITVGRICVTPPWHVSAVQTPASNSEPLTIVIQPSMGFGTGHHATTRLCLAALQAVDIAGKDVLDVGTGSGVLAIAAGKLGARTARGIDNDPDALQSAVENLGLNASVPGVLFELADLAAGLGRAVADIVTANLTGALLERAAPALLGAARPDGTIILSGLMTSERPAVEAAFSAARLLHAWEEDGWVALAFRT